MFHELMNNPVLKKHYGIKILLDVVLFESGSTEWQKREIRTKFVTNLL